MIQYIYIINRIMFGKPQSGIVVDVRPERVCCPRPRGNIQKKKKKRGKREHFGHWGSWSFVMLGSWVLDLTPSQTQNPEP